MNSRLLVLQVCLLCNVPCLLSAEDRVVDPVVLDRLRTQAVQDWQAMERGFRSVDVTYRRSYEDGPRDNMKLIAIQTFRFAYDADRQVALLRTQKDGLPGHMSHLVANPRYDFGVDTPDSKARGTLLKLNLTATANSDLERLGGVPNWYNHRCYLLAACRVSCLPLVELLNSTEFKIVETVEFNEPGIAGVRLSAKYLGEKGWGRIKGATYTATLDPAHRYRLLTLRIDTLRPSTHSFLVTYHKAEDVQTPREVIFRVDTGKHRSEQIWTFELPQPCTISDDEFYLPHYGFSEAVLETLQPNPWPRWLLIGFGILTIIIGAWLVRGRRQPAA